MMKNTQKYAMLLIVALSLMPLEANAATTISFDSLLHEMVDVDSIARWPEAEFTCKQASSYDRAKVAPDKPGWFANNDNTQYIRSEENDGRKEHVMMDAEGPGALVRFWLTAGGEKVGVLRVYLDGEASPALSFPAFDLLQGDLNIGAPLARGHPGYTLKGGGNTLYLPIPYAKHCKVTWEEKSKGQRYYQINYRTYSLGTEVKTFALTQVETAKGLIEKINRELVSPAQIASGKIVSLNESISPGNEATLELPTGANAVRAMELLIETANDSRESERALRSIIVTMTFDDEVTVWCPATDFFGSGVGTNVLRSWYRNANNDGTMRCRWVMPYEKSARITLQNVGSQSVQALLHATVSPREWDARSMHFHVAWHHESGLKTPPAKDWNFITVKARGVYVGDSLAIFNPVATWYGEGDEKIWVDGESFPSHMGTGTEDYYGYSYAPKPVHQTPFTNLVRIDQPMTQGWNVMSRTRNLDTIPFRQSLQFDFELISWKPTEMTYEATTYWYAFPGAASNIKPQPQDATLPIPSLADVQSQMAHTSKTTPAIIPGAIECETLKILRKSDGLPVFTQDMSNWGAARWSGGCQLVVKASKIGAFIELEVPVPDDKPRTIRLRATRAPDFGKLGFTVQGKSSDAVLDCYAESVQPADEITLGTFTPEKGRLAIRIEVTGANAKSGGARYFFGLDYLLLETAP
ncbi:MAG: DUF2961 domain-containing protein [Planctomycetota bacterium]